MLLLLFVLFIWLFSRLFISVTQYFRESLGLGYWYLLEGKVRAFAWLLFVVVYGFIFSLYGFGLSLFIKAGLEEYGDWVVLGLALGFLPAWLRVAFQ